MLRIPMFERAPRGRLGYEPSPLGVLRTSRMSRNAKLALLQRWADFEKRLEVAEGEGMIGGRPSQLCEVLCAMQRLRADPPGARGRRRAQTLAWLVVGALLGTTACQALDPYTSESRVNKTTKGAVIGAVGGAAAGAISGRNGDSRRKRALIGAGVGALAGGAVGAYMDRQAARLRQELAATGVSVTRNGEEVILNMPGDITFATDSADLRPEFYDVLNSVAKVLTEYDKTIVRVAGHTDDTGSTSHNQSLSERRAQAVARYLVTHNVAELRVEPLGLGESSPIASNASEDGRQRNRRVELVLVPLTEPS